MILISEQEGADGKLKYPDVFFTDKDLNNRYQYTYYLRCIDYLGHEGLPSEPVTVAPGDQTPPEPPQNMKIEVDGLKVNLSWESPDVPSPDMAGYHVYRSKRMNSGYLQANRTLLGNSTYSFTDNLTDPGEYFYYVAAVDSAGNEGGSFKDMADVQDVYPPAAPVGVTAEADSGKITLRWIANSEKDLWGYQVFRTVQRDDPSHYVLINSEPLTGTFFTDRLPAVSKNRFHYKVAAIDSSLNRSDYSDPVFGAMPDLTPPARPLIKKVTQQENALLVEWAPNVEADLKAYNVYRMNMNDSSSLHLNPRPVSRTVSRFTDLQVKPGIPYRYYITATDSSNNISAASEYFYATFVQDSRQETDNPVSSFKLSYRTGQKQVSLRWKLDSRPDFKGAIVFRSDGATFVPVTGLLRSDDYRDRDIEDDRSYTYRLHVFLHTGEVFKSKEIKVEVKAKK
jgi:predicted phage tail protein